MLSASEPSAKTTNRVARSLFASRRLMVARQSRSSLAKGAPGVANVSTATASRRSAARPVVPLASTNGSREEDPHTVWGVCAVRCSGYDLALGSAYRHWLGWPPAGLSLAPWLEAAGELPSA